MRSNAIPSTLAMAVLSCLPVHADESCEPEEKEVCAVVVEAEKEQMGSGREISLEQIQRNQSTDIADVFRDDPSVVIGGGARNAERIYLRGIEGTNLRISIDGASQGRNLFQHRGNLGGLDPELLKMVEVVTVAGADHGPGALGGSIRMETVDAQDLLMPGQNLGAKIKAGYASADEAIHGGGMAYGKFAGNMGLLAHVSGLDSEDYRIGGGDTVHGSAGEDREYFLKFSLLDMGGHSLRLSGEHNQNSGLYRYGAGDGGYDPEAALEYQNLERKTYVLDYRYRPAEHGLLDWRVNFYSNESLLENEDRQTEVSSEALGGDVRNIARFRLGSSEHALTVGVDYENEDGVQTSESVQQGTDNNASNLGIYLQERTIIGPVAVSFGARYDDYDTEFGEVSFSGSEVSPNASAELRFGHGWTGFVGYGESVRSKGIIPIGWLARSVSAPSFNQEEGKNSYGQPLQPETSKQREVGVRYRGEGVLLADDRFEAGLTLFDTDIENLIMQVGGSRGTDVTGFYNEDLVTAQGWELRGSWRFDGFKTSFAVTHVDTEDKNGDALAVSRRMGAATGDRFVWDNQWWIKHNLSLGYTMQVVAGLDEGVLQLPGYTLHDAQVQWRPMAMRNLTLSLAVRNIFDRLYREQTTIDYEEGVYEPGRDIRLTASYSF